MLSWITRKPASAQPAAPAASASSAPHASSTALPGRSSLARLLEPFLRRPSPEPASDLARARAIGDRAIIQLAPASGASPEQALLGVLLAALGQRSIQQKTLEGLPEQLRLLVGAGGGPVAVRTLLELLHGLVTAHARQRGGSAEERGARDRFLLQAYRMLLTLPMRGQQQDGDRVAAVHALVQACWQADEATAQAVVPLLQALRTPQQALSTDARTVREIESRQLLAPRGARADPVLARRALGTITAAELGAGADLSAHARPLLESLQTAAPAVFAAAVQGFVQACHDGGLGMAAAAGQLKRLMIAVTPTREPLQAQTAHAVRLAAVSLGMARALRGMEPRQAEFIHKAVREYAPADLDHLDDEQRVCVWGDPLLAGALAYGFCLGLSELGADWRRTSGWDPDQAPATVWANRMLGIATDMVADADVVLQRGHGQRGEELRRFALEFRALDTRPPEGPARTGFAMPEGMAAVLQARQGADGARTLSSVLSPARPEPPASWRQSALVDPASPPSLVSLTRSPDAAARSSPATAEAGAPVL